jgi:E2/UBC family protein E
MTPFEQQLERLKVICPTAKATRIASGANLIEIPNYKLPKGWNRGEGTVIFLAPPGYPAAQPDCFWVEPTGMRLENGATPQNTNDSNPIPGVGPRGTWFSWHVQHWNPNRDSLETYINVIKQRLNPAR